MVFLCTLCNYYSSSRLTDKVKHDYFPESLPQDLWSSGDLKFEGFKSLIPYCSPLHSINFMHIRHTHALALQTHIDTFHCYLLSERILEGEVSWGNWNYATVYCTFPPPSWGWLCAPTASFTNKSAALSASPECIQLTISKQIPKHRQGWNCVVHFHSHHHHAASQASQHAAHPSAEGAALLQGWPLWPFKPPSILNRPPQGFSLGGGSDSSPPGR